MQTNSCCFKGKTWKSKSYFSKCLVNSDQSLETGVHLAERCNQSIAYDNRNSFAVPLYSKKQGEWVSLTHVRKHFCLSAPRGVYPGLLWDVIKNKNTCIRNYVSVELTTGTLNNSSVPVALMSILHQALHTHLSWFAERPVPEFLPVHVYYSSVQIFLWK